MVTPRLDNVTHYTYDKLGRLVKTTSPIDAANSKVVKYYYDSVSGRHRFRESKSIGDVPTTYVWDGDQLVLEITGDTVRKYIRGLTLAACVTGNAPVYYQYDGHGSVVQLTDATGAVIKNYDYDAFGNHIVQSYDDANPFRYSGEYFDDETDLYYLRARYYWPSLGQFTQEDTYRGEPNTPLSLNLYTYCYNDPVQHIDPSGNFVETIFDVGSFFVSGVEFILAPSWETAGYFFWDAAALVAPGAPGSYVAKVVSKSDDVVDVVKGINKADNISDSAKVITTADNTLESITIRANQDGSTYDILKRYKIPQTLSDEEIAIASRYDYQMMAKQDLKMVDSAAREVGVDRNLFGEYIHQLKAELHMRPNQNFSYKELIEHAKELKKWGG